MALGRLGSDALSEHRRGLAIVQGLLEGERLELEGSFARGESDRWSDVDLVLAARTDDLGAEVRSVVERLRGGEGVFAVFQADHLPIPNLVISCIDLGTTVVKVDVRVEGPETKVLPCFGPPSWTRDELLARACTWTWYALGKVARGELLEAVDGMDVLRGRAVLPLWQDATGLAREGYRRAERRFPAGLLELSWSTRPRSLEPPELIRCLRDLLRSAGEAAERCGEPRHPGLAIVERELDRALR